MRCADGKDGKKDGCDCADVKDDCDALTADGKVANFVQLDVTAIDERVLCLRPPGTE